MRAACDGRPTQYGSQCRSGPEHHQGPVLPAGRVAPVTAYTAVCARAGKWWEITVPELEAGAVTQVRSLDEVESTVRDLVVLMTDASPRSEEHTSELQSLR